MTTQEHDTGSDGRVIGGVVAISLTKMRFDLQGYLLGYHDQFPNYDVPQDIQYILQDWIFTMALLDDWRMTKQFPLFRERYEQITHVGIIPALDHHYRESWRKAARDMPYQEYLQSPHWKRRRKEALEIYEYRCARCKTGKALHVHHKTYKRIGVEQYRDLLVLCADCHSKEHDKGNRS